MPITCIDTRPPPLLVGLMSVAVFLGAGASRAFGYPLTSELLPRVLQRLTEGILFDTTNTATQNSRDRQWFRKRLFAFLPGLQDSWTMVKDTGCQLGVTVTDLLTQVDRALAHTESRAGMQPEELTRFRQLLDRAIYEALVRNSESNTRSAQDYLGRFAQWLLTLPPGFGVLTTNYDTLVDRRLFEKVSHTSDQANRDIAAKVDFGFTWRTVDRGDLIPPPKTPSFYLLKLHGSLNWLRCSVCGQIYLNTAGPVGIKAFALKLDEWNTCHCNRWARLRLHLVTPSLVRQIQDPHLLGIWQAALEVLRTADEWIIAGYSLPAEDVAIRALFLRAWDGREDKPRIVVVQCGDAAKQTFRAFFPSKYLTYDDNGIESFIDRVAPAPTRRKP